MCVQALNRTHSQSSLSSHSHHSYHLYHSYHPIFHFSEGIHKIFCCLCAHNPSPCSRSHRTFLVVVGSVAIHLVYANANLHFEKVDQLLTLSSLSLDFNAMYPVVGIVVSISDYSQSAKFQGICSITTRAAMFPRETSVISSVVRLGY